MTHTTNLFILLKWSFFARISAQLLTLFVAFYSIRMLTSEDFGLFAIASLFISLMIMVCEAGIQSIIIKNKRNTKSYLKKILGLIILFHLSLSLLIIVSSTLIAEFYGDLRLSKLLIILSFNAVILIFAQIPSALLLKSMKIKTYSMIKLTSVIFQNIVLFSLIYFGFGIWSLISAQLLSNLLLVFVLNIKQPFIQIPLFQFCTLKTEINYAIHIISQRLIFFLVNFFDIALVGKLFGVVTLGYYSVANNIASMPRHLILQSVNHLTFPSITTIKHNKELVSSNLSKALNLMSLIIFPVSFGISALSEQFIHAVIGEKWLPSLFPLSTLPIVMPFRMLFAPITETFNALDLHTNSSKFQFFTMFNTIFFLYIGSFWGINGVCISWIIVVLFSQIYILTITKRTLNIGFSEFMHIIKGPLISSLLMYGIIKTTNTLINPIQLTSVTKFGFLILVGGISYLLLSLLLCKNSLNLVKKLVFEDGGIKS